MRNVLLLYSTEAAHYVTNDEKKKPYRYKTYDFTKAGVSIPDQWMGTLTCEQKTRKWTLVALTCPWYEQSQQSSNICNEFKGYTYKKLSIWLGIDNIAHQASHD